MRIRDLSILVFLTITTCGLMNGCDLLDESESSTMPGDDPVTTLTEDQEEDCFDAADAAASLSSLESVFSSVFDVTAQATEDSSKATPSDAADRALADEITGALEDNFGPGVQVERLSDDPVTLGVTFDNVETALGNTIDGYVEIAILDDGNVLEFTFDQLVVENKAFTGEATFSKLADDGGFSVATDELEIIWQTRQKTLNLMLEDLTMVLGSDDTIVTDGTINLITDDASLELTCDELTVVRTERYPSGQVALTIGDFSIVLTFDGTATVAIGDGEGIELKFHIPSGLRGTTLGRHMGSVRSVSFAPDNAFIASGGTEGHVKIWSVGSRRLYRPILAFEHAVYCVAYSPDGSQLAVAGEDQTVKLLNMEDYSEAASRELGASINALAWSPDGAFLALALQDASVRVLSAESESLVPVALLAGLTGHTERVLTIAWSPDGNTIASGGADRLIKIWDVSQGGLDADLARTLEGHLTEVTGVDFFPNGTLVSVGSNTRVNIWDVNTGDVVSSAAWNGQLDPILGFNCLSASNDDRWIVCGSFDDYPLVRWWHAGGVAVDMVGFESVRANADDTNSIDLSLDRLHLASGSSDGRVNLFRGL